MRFTGQSVADCLGLRPVTISSLSQRRPNITTQQILAHLVPPPTFSEVSFHNYVPDPEQPTQTHALSDLIDFADAINNPKFNLWRKRQPLTPPGRYLDGGFGVGKTHLLAALWHSVDGSKAFGTFVEYTNLVGALGFNETVEALAHNSLICIDEFELDDPGDTVLMSTLLMRLVERGVALAATSNTLPDRLGEERFAAEDFQREIQGLAAHFASLRIDGEDYRHRGLPEAPPPLDSDAIQSLADSTSSATLDDFVALSAHLSTLHPSKFYALVEDVQMVLLTDVHTITDQSVALRWVVLIDRLYDRGIPVRASGVPLDQLFSPELLKGGYRKKYRRAISRIVALSR